MNLERIVIYFGKHSKKFRYKAPKVNTIQPNQWVEHFKKLLYLENLGDLRDNIQEYSQNGTYDDVFNTPFHISEIRKSIRNLKLGKSGGLDGIVPEMVINTMNDISEILLILFNEIFNTGCFPNNWANSILLPIHKSGSMSDPNNFRGISLIDSLNKILTGILYDRLYSWAEENSKIDETQAGFRQGYSTIDNIFTLMSMGQKYLSKKGGRFYCLFVDFSKAFDRVNHVELINSLIRKGVHGKFLNLLISMYGSLCTCIKVDNDKCTSKFKCNIGTRQGCKLSTILFILFLNDLIEDLKNSGITGIQISTDGTEVLAIFYADDMASTSDTVRGLQAQINIIFNFCQRTDLKVNMPKTEVIAFRNGGYLREYERWHFNGEPIETVSSYKYMGLQITPKLIWTYAKECLSIQAKKSIVSLNKLQSTVGYFDYTEMFKLFDTMIKPVLCYGSEVWGFEISEQIENVHINFCKIFLKLPTCTFHVFVRGECGRYPMFIEYFCRCIKYWIKLTRMDQNRLPSKC